MVPAIVAILVVWGVYAIATKPSGKALSVDSTRLIVSSVTTGTFEDFIPIRGRVKPAKTVFLDAIEGGRVERILVESLQHDRPGYGFLLEEGEEIKSEDPEKHRFIIDPIDGTNNFMHGVPHFCMSIALQKGDDIIAGVIYDPIKDEMFYAERGGGAFMNDRRLRVSGRRDLNYCMVGTGAPSQRRTGRDYIERIQTVAQHVSCMRQGGSAALDLAYVAAGRVDGYLEMGLKPWDTAAGELIVIEAGGLVTDFVGGHNHAKSGNHVAGGTKVLREILKDIRPYLGDALAK